MKATPSQLLQVSLAMLLSLALAACSNSSNPQPAANDQQGEQTTGSTTGADVEVGILNKSNFSKVLTQVFEVYSGAAYDKRLTTMPYFKVDGFQCDNAGEYLLSDSFEWRSNATAELGDDVVEAVIKQCQMGGDTVNGSIKTEFDGQDTQVSFDTLTATFEPSGTMSVNGEYEFSCCDNRLESFKTNDTNYSIAYDGGNLAVTTLETELTSNWPEQGLLAGSFTMQPPVTNGEALEVSTAEDLSFSFDNLTAADAANYRDTWSFTSGRIVVVANDGSSVELNAVTGDPATVFVTIDNGTNTEVIEEQWSQWLPAINFKPGARFNTQPAEHRVTDLLNTIAGREIDELALDVVKTAERVRDQAPSLEVQDTIDEIVEFSTAEMARVITDGTLYQCPKGGEMLQQLANQDNGEFTTNANSATDRYVFRQCQIESSFKNQTDVEFTLNGTLAIKSGNRTASRSYTTSKSRSWGDFTIMGADQWQIAVNGFFSHSYQYAAWGSNWANFSNYRYNVVDATGATQQAIDVRDYQHIRNLNAGGSTNKIELSLDASVTGAGTFGETVTLKSLEQPLTSASTSSSQTAEASGLLTVSTTNGENISVTLNDFHTAEFEVLDGNTVRRILRRFRVPGYTLLDGL